MIAISGTGRRGQAIIRMMNAAGYDAAVQGNHDFSCIFPALYSFTIRAFNFSEKKAIRSDRTHT